MMVPAPAPTPAAEDDDSPPPLLTDSNSSLGMPLADSWCLSLTPEHDDETARAGEESPSPPRGCGGAEPEKVAGGLRITGDEMGDGDDGEPEIFNMDMDG
ncbi:hypothetical protein VP1G_08087 [Cytospora mali]|uniref:Uncharacterized protein n=1 Tax=Cytospora mali TaxID=578113 RepID=A0A194VA87_CYTMA|nr:hypothetical protein VP1G_08087 [Valsa mali var. pyri (nom. inval.)]